MEALVTNFRRLLSCRSSLDSERRASSSARSARRATTFGSAFGPAASTGQSKRQNRERQSKSVAGFGSVGRPRSRPHVFGWCRYNFLGRDSASLLVWNLGCRLARDS
jgi:hypothetical protein